MKLSLIASSIVLLAGCAAPLRSAPIAEEVMAPRSALPPGLDDASAAMHLPGDYAVFRLSGTYRLNSATVVQRVVSRVGGLLKLEVTVEDGAAHDVYRLRVDDASKRGTVLSVARVKDGHLEPFGVEAYEARMKSLVPAADSNDGVMARSTETLRVGEATLLGLRTDYRVRIGRRSATMSTFGIDGFPGENLGGKIVTDDGTVVYHAQLVELGNDLPRLVPVSGALAVSEPDFYDSVDE